MASTPSEFPPSQCPGCSLDTAWDGRTIPVPCVPCLERNDLMMGSEVAANQAKSDEEEVYIAFKDVFASTMKKYGKKSSLVARKIQHHKEEEHVKSLINRLGFQAVTTIAKRLITSGVFRHPGRAEARFPKHKVPDQDAEDTASGDLPEPSLLARDLPFPAQHQILCKLQRTLEFLCYEFAQAHMQQTLQAHGWDCAELVQLSQWAEEFQRNPACLVGIGNSKGYISKGMFQSMNEIQKAAVERENKDTERLKALLSDAHALSDLLKVGGQHSDLINKLRDHVQVALEDMNEHDRLLQSNLDIEQSRIATERDKLAAEEHEATTQRRIKGEEYNIQIGARLVESITRINYTLSAPGSVTSGSMVTLPGVQTPPEE